MMGDVQGWGDTGGSREARLTFRQTLQAQVDPALQVMRSMLGNPPTTTTSPPPPEGV